MKHIFLIIISSILLFNSCKKSSLGGHATVIAFPQHHGEPILGATIYVKFKAKDMPSNPTSNYDLKIVGGENDESVRIEGLRYGDYYIYAEGIDIDHAELVSGGIPLSIKWSKRKKEINLDVAVTE